MCVCIHYSYIFIIKFRHKYLYMYTGRHVCLSDMYAQEKNVINKEKL